MLAEERRQEILNILNNRGSVHVTEMSKVFDVTEETIRRDLEKMDSENLLKRTHGGAVALETREEISFNLRKQKYTREKQMIANKAAELINNGDTIFLDASTTAMHLARKLINFNDLTIITNSGRIIFELAENKNLSIISTGGLLRANSLSYVGPLANETIKKYYADKFFTSCNGISLKHGATDSNELELEVKRNMVSRSNQVIVLAVHSKFNEIGLAQFAPPEKIDKIITDEEVDKSTVKRFREKGVEVEF